MSAPAKTIAPNASSIARFVTKFTEDDPDKCWPWQAYINPGGYGTFWNGERLVVAHRFAYEVAVGPIPDGLYLDHLCRNRCCVNPNHLEPVTHRENTMRGVGPCVIRVQLTHCKRGHEFTSENSITLESGARRCRICKRASDLRRWHKQGLAAKRAVRRRQQTAVTEPDLTYAESATVPSC